MNVKIYGTNPDGIYAIPKSSVFDKVAPTTKYEPDPSVPKGTLVLDKEQYAYTGWSAHTYRYIYDKDGNLLEKQDMGSSKYSMRPNLYHYNPADGDPSTWPDGKPPQPGTDPGTEVPVDPSTETGGTAGPDVYKRQEVRPRWQDGTPAHTVKLFGVVNRYDLRKEFPILTVRKQFLKSAVDELLWIWQKKSNNIHELNSHVWDAWADENGSIGKAYGYQLGVKHHYPQGLSLIHI